MYMPGRELQQVGTPTYVARLRASSSGLLSNTVNLIGFSVKGVRDAAGVRSGNILAAGKLIRPPFRPDRLRHPGIGSDLLRGAVNNRHEISTVMRSHNAMTRCM